MNQMLEGKELILATKPYAKDDTTKSWFHTLSTLACLIVAMLGALSPIHLGFRIIFSLLTGLLLVRMFIIYHDFAHHTILKGSKIANIIFTLFGLYILNPKSIWKRSHNYHHKHNSKLSTSYIGSFPVMTRQKYLSISPREQKLYLFSRHPFTIAAGYFFVFIWGMCIQSLAQNPSKHWDSAVALALHIGIGLTLILTLGWSAFFLGFFIPAILSNAIGAYLFYAQHNFPGVTFYDKEGWTYIGAALKSSSYMKMNPIMRWFTGNIGYHHIHHTNARIPFYRLPEVYHAFPEFQQAKTTSLNPVDMYNCLKLKVWDPQLNRMLTLEEIYSHQPATTMA